MESFLELSALIVSASALSEERPTSQLGSALSCKCCL